MKITQKKFSEAYDILFEALKQNDDEKTILANQTVDRLRGKGLSDQLAIEILKKPIQIIDDLSGTHELL